MAAPVGGPFPRVGTIIGLFVAMGCELRILDGRFQNDDGSVYQIRFLFNPELETFASLSDLQDSDRVSWSEVESWERLLSLKIPKG